MLDNSTDRLNQPRPRWRRPATADERDPVRRELIACGLLVPRDAAEASHTRSALGTLIDQARAALGGDGLPGITSALPTLRIDYYGRREAIRELAIFHGIGPAEFFEQPEWLIEQLKERFPEAW